MENSEKSVVLTLVALIVCLKGILTAIGKPNEKGELVARDGRVRKGELAQFAMTKEQILSALGKHPGANRGDVRDAIAAVVFAVSDPKAEPRCEFTFAATFKILQVAQAHEKFLELHRREVFIGQCERALERIGKLAEEIGYSEVPGLDKLPKVPTKALPSAQCEARRNILLAKEDELKQELRIMKAFEEEKRQREISEQQRPLTHKPLAVRFDDAGNARAVH